MIAYWPVLALVALICIVTSAITTATDRSRLTGRRKEKKQ